MGQLLSHVYTPVPTVSLDQFDQLVTDMQVLKNVLLQEINNVSDAANVRMGDMNTRMDTMNDMLNGISEDFKHLNIKINANHVNIRTNFTTALTNMESMQARMDKMQLDINAINEQTQKELEHRSHSRKRSSLTSVL